MTEFANDYKDFDITLPQVLTPNPKGEVYTKCPVCGPHRKKEHQHLDVLGVNITKGVWNCNHCAWTGGLTPTAFLKGKKIVNTSPLQKCNEGIYAWFEKRMISRMTVDWAGIKFSVQSVRQKDTGEFVSKNCTAFVSKQRGLTRMIKYRDGKKNFKIAPESTLIAWGLGNLREQTIGCITEGEIDALSYIESGFKGSTSVPNGTTLSVKEKTVYDETGKFPSDVHLNLTWLDNCYEDYEHLELIYICTDDDPAGIKLRNELGRRFGFDRCKIVKYSNYTYLNSKGEMVNCKDANEVLIHHGKAAVLKTLEDAEPFPITDLVTVNDINEELDDIYKNGIVKGKSTGYPHLDPHFNWSDGHLIFFNGYPGNGKTSILLNLILLHAKMYNSRWAIYTPENYPVKNFYTKCIEIYGGNTLDNVPNRMEWSIFSDAKKFVNEHIKAVNCSNGYTPLELRNLSLRLIKNMGINGFVVDPWNALNESKEKYDNSDDRLTQELSAEQRFAINTNTNRIILAHPPTPLRDKDKVYPAPSAFEMKGGGIWFAKAYELVCAHLRHIQEDEYQTEFHVQKVKDEKETGLRTRRDNPVLFKFVRRSGRYIQPDGYDPFEQHEKVEEPQMLDLNF